MSEAALAQRQPFALRDFDDIPTHAAERFFRQVYTPGKASFLLRHGTWWHNGNSHRLALAGNDGEMAAYCAFIPTRCRIEGRVHHAAWWIDLVVLRKHRGLGLQSILDREMRSRFELLLGFPNEVAAAIHRKHGWGIREDGRALLLPLIPSRLRSLSRIDAWYKPVATGAGRLLDPIVRMLATRSRTSPDIVAIPISQVARLADVFESFHDPGVTTTVRSSAHLQWRFSDSPFSRDQQCFAATRAGRVTTALVTRVVESDGIRSTRIVDLFGDTSNSTMLRRLISCAVVHAAGEGSVQLAAVTFRPAVRRALRLCGFVGTSITRFCWFSPDQATMRALQNAQLDWTFADSDNDEPERCG